MFKNNVSKRKIISDDLFNELVLSQYINTDVSKDIFLILTPEGRAINNKLSCQSSLQMFAYMNLHLNKKFYTSNLFISQNIVDALQLKFDFKRVKDLFFRGIKLFVYIVFFFI